MKNGIAMNDWLFAMPVPFTSQLHVYIKAPEDGKANLRLIDAAGRLIDTKALSVVRNNFYTINFESAALLARGVYFVQYVGGQRKTIRVIK